MAYGQIFFGDVMICAGEGTMFGRFIYQTNFVHWKSNFSFSTVGKAFCTGDTGGPITYQGTHVGIVSWGYGCARPYFPGKNISLILINNCYETYVLSIWFFLLYRCICSNWCFLGFYLLWHSLDYLSTTTYL